MELEWTAKVLSDLASLYEFLAPVNRTEAARVIRQLIATSETLLTTPRLGERLEEFELSDVRRLPIGDYELRYEISQHRIVLVWMWHSRNRR